MPEIGGGLDDFVRFPGLAQGGLGRLPGGVKAVGPDPDAAPDVVGLQEVDSCVKRSGYIPEAAVLGNKLGMYSTFGPAIPLTGGKYGVAILS